MASGILRGPEGVRGQTGEQGRETEAGKRVCANQLSGHGSTKHQREAPDSSANKTNIPTTHRLGCKDL